MDVFSLRKQETCYAQQCYHVITEHRTLDFLHCDCASRFIGNSFCRWPVCNFTVTALYSILVLLSHNNELLKVIQIGNMVRLKFYTHEQACYKIIPKNKIKQGNKNKDIPVIFSIPSKDVRWCYNWPYRGQFKATVFDIY